MIRPFFSLAAMGLLCACSSGGESPIGAAIKGAVGQVTGRGEAEEAPSNEDIDAQLAQLQGTGQALRVELPKFNLVAGASPISVNGPKVTWISGGATLTTQSGFVLATRGLTEDLMAVEVAGFGEALSGGGRYTREMEWLNGRDETVRSHFDCMVSVISGQTVAVLKQSYSATLYQDVCSGEDTVFTNKYWIDNSKVLRQTEQWISPEVGYLQTQQISN